MGDNKFWFRFWVVVGVTVCFVSVCITTSNIMWDKTYVEAGYVKAPICNSYSAQWVQPAPQAQGPYRNTNAQ